MTMYYICGRGAILRIPSKLGAEQYDYVMDGQRPGVRRARRSSRLEAVLLCPEIID